MKQKKDDISVLKLRKFMGRFFPGNGTAFTGSPKKNPVQSDRTSGFLDNKTIRYYAPITKELSDFHPALKEILSRNKGVRKWEYGALLRGIQSWENMKVLDIGAGPSVLPIFLASKRKARVTVLDLAEPYSIDFEKMSNRLLQAGVQLKVGDMRNIPCADNSFDIVVSISAIEHLSHSADYTRHAERQVFIQETKQTLAEMVRVVRPGGWIYLTSDAYIPGQVQNDRWGKKLIAGNPFAAYAIGELHDVFLSTLEKLGVVFPYPVCYDPSLLAKKSRYSSYRDRYMTVFNLFARKSQ